MGIRFGCASRMRWLSLEGVEGVSSGSISSNRLGIVECPNETSCFVASHGKVFAFKHHDPSSAISLTTSVVADLASGSKSAFGKQIQHIAAISISGTDSSVVAAVDSLGAVSLVRCQSRDAEYSGCVTEVSGTQSQSHESSWSGVTFAQSHSKLFSAHALSRTIQAIDISDQVAVVSRTFNTTFPPSQILAFSGSTTGVNEGESTSGGNSSSCVVAGEGGAISVWDVRVQARAGCVQRVQIESTLQGQHECTSLAQHHHVIACGFGRAVKLFDTRKWNAVAAWQDCTKHKVVWVGMNQNQLFVAGIDRELLCGDVNGNHITSIGNSQVRANGRWLGLRTDSSGRLFGYADSAEFCVIPNNYFLTSNQ
eukprot:c7281_g1_i2.p1 GENE.c7281_g1_i2~~c7281_g1_i2.p1  ORF type:complete len:367 (-),score=90.25 c7281_g1_i2:48-1148(-)